MDANSGAHRILPVSVAVIKDLQTMTGRDHEGVRQALEECVDELRAAVPELKIDWNSLSLSSRYVSGTAPADQVDRLHSAGLGVGALVSPIIEYDVSLDAVTPL